MRSQRRRAQRRRAEQARRVERRQGGVERGERRVERGQRRRGLHAADGRRRVPPCPLVVRRDRRQLRLEGGPQALRAGVVQRGGMHLRRVVVEQRGPVGALQRGDRHGEVRGVLREEPREVQVRRGERRFVRGEALGAPGVGVRARLQQGLGRLEVAVPGGDVQRRFPEEVGVVRVRAQ